MTMRAIDTNILVRLLVAIDPEQRAIAQKLAAEHTLIVIPTVVLETEWVLRSVVKANAARVNQLLRAMLMTDGLVVTDRHIVVRALDLHAAGMDFADAMHVCACPVDQTFVTFDRDLVRRANRFLPDARVELAV